MNILYFEQLETIGDVLFILPNLTKEIRGDGWVVKAADCKSVG